MRTKLIGLISILLVGLCVWHLQRMPSTIKHDFFPQDTAVPVAYQFTDLSYEEFSEREQEEQVRDWLLLTILSNINLAEDALNDATFDLPPVRYGFLQKVSNLEFGKTRSKYLGDDLIVALVPECSKEEEFDYLAHIVDQHRRDLNFIPATIEVFQYEISLEEDLALITRKEAVDTKIYFDEDSGYTETTIKELKDLQRFMLNNQDVTIAEIDAGVLTIGGRKLKSRDYGNIDLEDIAAIFQSEMEVKRKLDAFEAKWNRVTYYTEEEGERLARQMLKEQKEQAIVDGSGFSLDPFFDCPALLTYVKRNKELFSVLPDYSYRTIISGLEENDSDPLLIQLGNIIHSYPEKAYSAQSFLEEINGRFKYQKARYDGFLQGTEVGMNLFYTDLMAKLWTFNFNYAAPKSFVPEFVCNTDVRTSKTFSEESRQFDSNRLWFSPDNTKFQLAESGDKLLFARNATRIYSASSNQLKPGEEAPSAAFWEKPLNWWNNHFEEVAAYEPQYEKLNEIVKWSVIITWLIDENKDYLLSFLNSVAVNRNNWFPEWAENNPDLKFDRWKDIDFYPKGFKGSKTEVIPILKSPPSLEGGWIVGGVSLSSKNMVRSLNTVPKKLVKGGRLNRPDLVFDSYSNKLVSSKGNSFKINNTSRVKKVTTEAAQDARLRNRFSELYNEHFERQLLKNGNQVEIGLDQGGKRIGALRISGHKNGFEVGFRSRSMEMGQHFSRKISDSVNPLEVLSNSPEVNNFIVLEKNASQGIFDVAVNFKNSDSWLRIKVGDVPEVNLGGEWHARVAGNGNFSRNCKLQWMGEGDLFNNHLAKAESVTFNPSKGINIFEGKITAQEAFKPFELRINGKTYNARFNAQTQEVHLAKSDLWEITLNKFREHLRPDQMDKLGEMMKNGGRLFQPRGDLPAHRALLRDFASNDVKYVARNLSDAPDLKVIKGDLAKAYEPNLKFGDDLLNNGQFEKAYEHFDAMAKVYGPSRPEVFFKRGAALIRDTKKHLLDGTAPPGGFSKLNKNFAGNSRFNGKGNRKIYEELNKVLKESSDDFARNGLDVIDNFLQAHLLPNTKCIKGVDVTKFAGKGVKANSQEVLTALKTNKGRLFIQDNPSLNNLDWTVHYERSLNTVLNKYPDAILEKIPKEGLANYNLKLVNGPDFMGFGNPSLKLTKFKQLRAGKNLLQQSPYSNPDSTAVVLPEQSIQNGETYIIYIPSYNPREAYDQKVAKLYEGLTIDGFYESLRGASESSEEGMGMEELEELLKSYMDKPGVNNN